MNREELIYLIPYLLSLALSSGIVIYAWRRQTVAGARPFAWLASTQAAWTFGFILELITPTLSGKLFWDAFQWVGGIVMPLIFPAFTIEYANFQIKRPRLVWGSLAAFPLILLILVLTSGYHKLLYPNPHLVPGEPFSSLDYDFTALFWASSLYVYAIIIGCMIVLIQKFGRSFPLYRSQVFIIAAGAAFPILVTFLPLIGINITPQRDPTPFTFAIGNLIIGVGLFHYRLLDLVPIARERVLEDMTDAIIVLDASNRVVDMNHAALANVGKTSPEVIGRPAQEVFAEWPELREQTQNLGNTVLEVSAMVKGEHRMYDLSVSSIRDQMNRLIGWVFVAHDITARKMLEDRYRQLSEELEERVLERTEDLRESEFRLQAAIDAAHIGLWDWELTSGKVTSLGHHDKMFGFAPGEFGGTYSDFEKRVHPEDAEELNRLIQLAREAGSEYTHEYRVVWPDGTLHWIAGRGRFEYNASGEPVRMRGAVLDISERRQAEEEIRRYATQMEALAEISRTFAEAGLDYQSVLNTVAQRTAELIGDACVMTLFSDDGQRSYPVAFYHRDPKALDTMHEALLYTWQGGTDTQRYEALLSGNSIYIPEIDLEEFRASLEPEFQDFFEAVGITSLIIVPLQVQGRVIGTLGLTRDRHGPSYTRDDQALLQNIGDRAALTIQNARLFEQVHGARKSLAALSRRLLEVQEAERRALTSELHDRVGQNLTGLSISLQNMKAMLSGETAQILAIKFDDAQALVQDTTRHIRDIMAELHLSELEDYGLAVALETYAERVASRGNLELIADLPDLPPPRLSAEICIALFRAAQEAITNVLKHANATQLEVSLEGQDGRIHLRVEDDGQGFDPNGASQKEAQTWGLKIMRERIESIGGKVQIESEPGLGTRVTFEIERSS